MNEKRNHQINVALAQTKIIWEDKEQNYALTKMRIEEAVCRGAEAVFFPEMSFTGFSMNTEDTKEQDAQTIQRMKEMAQQYQVSLGFGWVKDCEKRCENHYTIVDRKGIVLSDYAKLHPFSYAGEDLKFQGGSALASFSINGIACSCFICYDLRFPEIFQAASRTAHVIIVPANWPAKRSAHWKALLRARAIENQVYILAINCVGDIGGVDYTGDSCIIDPEGGIRVMLSGTEGNLCYTLTDNVESFRAAFPVKLDRREQFYRGLYEKGLGETL